ncbi:DMT family transporter [Clostridium sp.]|uniref:DMT family transporter n=1 Tax=Clostridium sp. TaxID=1506 RepID=UPI003D6CB01D
MDNKKIYILMVLSALFWGGAFIAGKLSVPFIPVYTLTFLRFFVATFILFFVVKYKDKSNYKLTKKDVPIFLFTGIIGMFGYHVFFFSALKYTTAINSSLIAATNPIITTILCIIFLKDKITFKRAIGIFLSFSGVFLTITNANLSIMRNLSLNKGDLLMLVAVSLWAAYSVFSKIVIHKFSPLILTFYSFLFCTIFLIPFVIYDRPWMFIMSVPYYSFVAVLYMSIFASIIGYLVQQMSIKQIGPSKTSNFINLVPIFSIILSVAILKENMSIVKFFTGILIVTGVYICQKS